MGGLLIAEVVAEVIVYYDLRRFRSGFRDPNADVPGYLYDGRSAELAGEESQEIGRHRHAGRS